MAKEQNTQLIMKMLLSLLSQKKCGQTVKYRKRKIQEVIKEH